MTTEEKSKLLIIEDDESIRVPMKWALAQDYEVMLAEDRPSALKLIKKEHPVLVTLDLGLPPNPRGTEEGFKALGDILELDPFIKVVIITGQGEKENAINAVGQGAYDFFCKPIQVDELKVILRRALLLYQLEEEHRELQKRVSDESFENMLGTSPQIQELFDTIRKVATTDASILILGESGTGKELVAKAIHSRSSRKQGPFVPINCGAIPENLMETELFGHEKGAFTGAHKQKKGRVESAQNGTLFLDEIGELSLSLQVKLLRFLQEHRIERVGGQSSISVDARVLAATNRDLQKAMEENTFREDLYYRLGVVIISVPPLREREGDIPFLARAFMEKYAVENNKKITGFSQQALVSLEAYEWPGNVRELENRVKRAVIMAQKSKLTPEDLELGSVSGDGVHAGMKLREARELVEKELIVKALARNKGNLTRTASELGISRPALYQLMDKLEIERKSS